MNTRFVTDDRAAQRTAGSQQRVVVPPSPLVIPLETGYAVIPLGITRDDFDTLKKTLTLWEKRIVKPDNLDDYEI